jgi:glycerophosphoryl diester phosphodiesterase
VIAERAGDRRVTVCARAWPIVDPMRGLQDVRLVRSIGGRRGLAGVLGNASAAPLDGISVHRRLLTPEFVAQLKRRAAIVMTWPVASAEEAATLAAWGVDGMITENSNALLRALATAR